MHLVTERWWGGVRGGQNRLPPRIVEGTQRKVNTIGSRVETGDTSKAEAAV